MKTMTKRPPWVHDHDDDGDEVMGHAPTRELVQQDVMRQGIRWQPVSVALVREIGAARALLLTSLLQAIGFFGDADGWCLAYPSFLERNTGITPDRQKPIIDFLTAQRLIQRRLRNNGKAPWYRANVEAIRALLHKEANDDGN